MKCHREGCSKALGFGRRKFCGRECYLINHKVYRAQWQRSRRKHVRCGHCKGPLPLLKGNGHRRGAHYGYCSPACFVEGKRADHRAYQRERVIGHGWAYLFRNPKQGVPRT